MFIIIKIISVISKISKNLAPLESRCSEHFAPKPQFKTQYLQRQKICNCGNILIFKTRIRWICVWTAHKFIEVTAVCRVRPDMHCDLLLSSKWHGPRRDILRALLTKKILSYLIWGRMDTYLIRVDLKMLLLFPSANLHLLVYGLPSRWKQYTIPLLTTAVSLDPMIYTLVVKLLQFSGIFASFR
jgi:hypothetical protein